MGGRLGKLLKLPLPMQIQDPAGEDSGDRVWLLWGEAEHQPARKAPLPQVEVAPDEAWDLFGSDEPIQQARPGPSTPACVVSPVLLLSSAAASETLLSSDYWLSLLPLALRSELQSLASPPRATAWPRESSELMAHIESNGYVTCPPPQSRDYLDSANLLLKLIIALSERDLPPAFAYLYDATWHFILRIWPLVEDLLGGRCVIEPSFAAFRLNRQKSLRGSYVGNNFAKPHRDYNYADSFAPGIARPQLLSVWIPLCDVDLKNGCMYVVPRSKDPQFNDPISKEGLQEPDVPPGGLTPLAPHPAGSFMCWTGNTIHWGSGCEREGADNPRTSLALVFRLADRELSQPEASLSREDVLTASVAERLRQVAAAVRFFGHWYEISPDLQRLMAHVRSL